MTRLLLVHGAGAGGRVWDALAPRLAALGPVEAPDLPGHGGVPAVGPPDLGAYVDALRPRVGPEVVVVGHSMGGALAALLALEVPLAGVVLVGAGLRFRVSPALLAGIGDDVEALRDGLTWVSVAPDADDDTRARVRARVVDAPPAVVAGDLRALDGLDLRARAAGITCPLLAVSGAADALIPPKLGAEAAALVPRGRFVELAGVGHTPQLEAPDRLAEKIAGFVARGG